MERGRAAGQRIVCVVASGQNGLLQSDLDAAVGAVEANLLAGILLHDLRNVLEYRSLGTGHASVAGRVGAVTLDELDAVAFSGHLHRVALCNDGLVGQVTGEGVVHDHVAAPLGSLVSDLVAAADLVNGQDDVRSSGDVRRILGGNAGDQQDVIAAQAILDLGEGGNCALNALNEDDGLDVGIACEGDQLGNGGLDLRGEVVRIGVV